MVGETPMNRRGAKSNFLHPRIPKGFRPKAQRLRGSSYPWVIVRPTSSTATRLRQPTLPSMSATLNPPSKTLSPNPEPLDRRQVLECRLSFCRFSFGGTRGLTV